MIVTGSPATRGGMLGSSARRRGASLNAGITTQIMPTVATNPYGATDVGREGSKRSREAPLP
jgi:hypothetical protein